jgi:uroporphyrin-III C-methyltransferase
MQEPPQSEQQETNQETPLAPHTRQGLGSLFLATTALVIAILSLLSPFFYWRLHTQTNEQILSENKSAFDALKQELLSTQREMANQQESLNRLASQNQTEERRKSIMLADEALHLLRLANFNIRFVNDFDLAIKQVAEADQTLQQIPDTNIGQIRTALTNDLTALNNTPKTDINGVISRISAISNQVSGLSSIPIIPPSKVVKTLPKINHTWKEKLMETFNNLKGILSIRRMPQEIEPLALPEQQLYILEGIRLKLSEAEWAVLHQNLALYQASLEEAKKRLGKYYAQNPSGANLIKMINDLQQINIKPNPPDLSGTLNQLYTYINSAQQQPSLNANQTPKPIMPPNLQASPNYQAGNQNNIAPPAKASTIVRALPS